MRTFIDLTSMVEFEYPSINIKYCNPIFLKMFKWFDQLYSSIFDQLYSSTFDQLYSSINVTKPLEYTSPTISPHNDRIIRESERQKLTSISRSQAYKLELRGLFPKRIQLGYRSVGWRYSEIMDWIANRPKVSDTTNYPHGGK